MLQLNFSTNSRRTALNFSTNSPSTRSQSNGLGSAQSPRLRSAHSQPCTTHIKKSAGVKRPLYRTLHCLTAQTPFLSQNPPQSSRISRDSLRGSRVSQINARRNPSSLCHNYPQVCQPLTVRNHPSPNWYFLSATRHPSQRQSPEPQPLLSLAIQLDSSTSKSR